MDSITGDIMFFFSETVPRYFDRVRRVVISTCRLPPTGEILLSQKGYTYEEITENPDRFVPMPFLSYGELKREYLLLVDIDLDLLTSHGITLEKRYPILSATRLKGKASDDEYDYDQKLYRFMYDQKDIYLYKGYRVYQEARINELVQIWISENDIEADTYYELDDECSMVWYPSMKKRLEEVG